MLVHQLRGIVGHQRHMILEVDNLQFETMQSIIIIRDGDKFLKIGCLPCHGSSWNN